MLKAVVLLCVLGAAVCDQLDTEDTPVFRTAEDVKSYRDFLVETQSGKEYPKSPNASVWENSGKYQGDIVLDDEDINYMVDQYAGARNGDIRGVLWPLRTVVYQFAAGHFDAAQQNHIRYAMQVISQRTCINFRPRANNEFNYALITGNRGCFASVGFRSNRGAHTMNVERAQPGRGCLNTIVIIHEWLHVIGFYHMQSTYNRDQWVRINWANIMSGMGHNFDRYGNNVVSNLGLPYEYASCMHYEAHAFSVNGRPTMDALRAANSAMGPMTHVTSWDFQRVDRLYRCQAWRKDEDYLPYYPDPREGTDGFLYDLDDEDIQ